METVCSPGEGRPGKRYRSVRDGIQARWQVAVACCWGIEGVSEIETVNLGFESLDAVEDLDKRLVFPRSPVSQLAVWIRRGRGGALGLLCRLGNAIVAFETEFLASATFWTLFITPLLPAPACIASLGWSEDGHVWQMVRQGRRNRAHLGSNGTSLLSEVRSGGSQQGTGGRRGNRRGMCVTHHPHGTEVMRRGGTLREPEGEDELTLDALEAEAGEEGWTSGCELFARAGLGSEACPHPRPSRGRWPIRCLLGGGGLDRAETRAKRAQGRSRRRQGRAAEARGRCRASEGTESGGRRRSDGLGVLRVGAETGDGGRGTGWSCGIGEWSTWGPVVCTRRRRKR